MFKQAVYIYILNIIIKKEIFKHLIFVKISFWCEWINKKRKFYVVNIGGLKSILVSQKRIQGKENGNFPTRRIIVFSRKGSVRNELYDKCIKIDRDGSGVIVNPTRSLKDYVEHFSHVEMNVT